METKENDEKLDKIKKVLQDIAEILGDEEKKIEETKTPKKRQLLKANENVK